MQAVLADQVGADAGEVAFVGAGEALEQQARDDQAQDGVAEELEPLVVVGAEAAMGQGPLQERRVGEAVADALLQGDEAGIHASKAARSTAAASLVRASLVLDRRKTGFTSSISLS